MAELTTNWSMLKQEFVGKCNSGSLYIRAYARLVSQDISKNQSKVQYNVSTYYENSSYANDNQGQVSVAGTGLDWKYKTVTNVTRGENSWLTYDATVNHNADGTANISASAWIKFPNWGHTKTATGYASLPRIPRQANLTSAPNFNDEQNPTINYSNSAGNAVESLQACIYLDDIHKYIAYYRDIPKSGNSYTFNLSESERKILREYCTTKNSREVTFYVTTVIGGNTYHSTTKRTATIINGNPSLSVSAIDTLSQSTTLTGNNSKIIKGFNNVSAQITATAKKGATITGYSIKNGNSTINKSSGTFNNSESGDFIFSVTDSRGNSTSKTITVPIVDYVKLTNSSDIKPANTSGELKFDVSGNYFNASFGAVANTLAVQYRYKENTGNYGAWTNIPISLSGNSYNGSVSLKGLNYRNSYTFQTRAIDKIYTDGISSPEKTVKTTPVFDWGMNDFRFNVPVSFQGKELIDLIYPVGSIYMSVNSTNPQTLFGGTWERWGNGRVPVGIDTSQSEFNTVEKTGGEKSHKLTVSEMPSHEHIIRRDDNYALTSWQTNASGGNLWWIPCDGSGSTEHSYKAASAGGNGTHNNLQPYITCYMWKRTA